MRKYIGSIFIIGILSSAFSVSSKAAWIQKEDLDQWQYEVNGSMISNQWIKDNEEDYYIDSNGFLKSGWLQPDTGTWYFLNPVHDGTYGKVLKGWQWIDGFCYFFQNDGKMLSDTITPDGYQVNSNGAWSKDGQPQNVPDKGIITIKPESLPKVKPSGGGGSGGGSSSGGSGGSGSRPQNTVYTYTICHIDIDTKFVLHVMTAQGKKNEIISISHPDYEKYVICQDQKTEFELSVNNQVINIFYKKQIDESPSDPARVIWTVQFVEEGSTTKEIFKSQEGISEEGKELLIDFPELILKNGTYYQSLVKSPYRIFLHGSGIQKYYIEYSKSEAPEEPDPDAPATERLNNWLELSRLADEDLTGNESMEGQLITNTIEDSNQRLENLLSMAEDTDRHEVYLIAKNHTPSAFVLGQLPNIGSISEMIMDSFSIEEEKYIILKVGFECSFEADSCSHYFEVNNEIEAGCLTNGVESVNCKKCGYEATVIVPAVGHKDADHDDMCDVCYETITDNETPEAAHYELGDMQARQIGNKIYLFRCIDEDYEDSLNNKQKTALFLCEQVIRADIDSTSENHKTLSFGGNNNYKNSAVRNWLKKNAIDSLFSTHTSYIGLSLAYAGTTEEGSFEQFDERSLTAKNKPFQMIEDNIFVLSVEEAIKYREYLWQFDGADVNNPESQYSAYSKGYWLRTPQYTEADGQFAYGAGTYAVDLLDGNIHTVDVSNTSIGIRPVITMLQN